ncbi:hypothetical protein [Rhodococcus marinonascens]|uniref:hypothetical protein n=1 Tax=Rhodococcus marinonascens TaxID=38311 RepID=UPI0009342046|nr:hypothetical protein [Rhodococcus marinonascens]
MPDCPRWSAAATVVVLAGCAPLATVTVGSAQSVFLDRAFVDASEFTPDCTPDDSGVGAPEGASLDELSGLASTGGLLYAVGDSGSDRAVAVMGADCVVHRWLPLPVDPYDVEDMAVGPDGRLWLADVGDNGRRRDTVALIAMDRDTGAGELHRLTYPDGPHDAETILIQRDGTPLIVTKELFGAGSVYRPVGGAEVGGLATPGPTPLEKVGVLDVSEASGADAEGGGTTAQALHSTMFTGGAVSADGTVAAVRNYSDVFLFSAPDGDLLAAFASGPAVRARVPQQPQGEAVAFTENGDLLIASEARGGPIPPVQMLPGAVSLVQDQARAHTAAEEESAESAGSRWGIGIGIGIAAVSVVALTTALGYVVRRRARSEIP